MLILLDVRWDPWNLSRSMVIRQGRSAHAFPSSHQNGPNGQLPAALCHHPAPSSSAQIYVIASDLGKAVSLAPVDCVPRKAAPGSASGHIHPPFLTAGLASS